MASLLQKQADVSAATNDGLTALMTAAYKVSIPPPLDFFLRMSLKRTNSRVGPSLLQKGRESVVELLLRVHADVNATANLGVTALMGAADKGASGHFIPWIPIILIFFTDRT